MMKGEEIDQLLKVALTEDIGEGDIVTMGCIGEEQAAEGMIYTKQKGLIAGLHLVEGLFRRLDSELTIELLVPEGSFQKAGVALMRLMGGARPILTGERTALNILQHASGIATMTGDYVRKLVGTTCRIMDTRRTLPGLRALEKYAVRVGGGVNLRFGLDDRLIVKSNHQRFLASEELSEVIARLKKKAPGVAIDVEVCTLAQADKALKCDIDALMIYGMVPPEVRKCVAKAHSKNTKVIFQTSLALPMDALQLLAATGLDGIAIGTLMAAAAPLDIGMRIQPLPLAAATLPINSKFSQFITKE